MCRYSLYVKSRHQWSSCSYRQLGVVIRRGQVAAHRVERERPRPARRVEHPLAHQVGDRDSDKALGQPVRSCSTRPGRCGPNGGMRGPEARGEVVVVAGEGVRGKGVDNSVLLWA